MTRPFAPRPWLPALALALLPLAAPSAAQGIDETVVFIECTSPGQTPRRGSGVLVSPEGHVLTAKHVVFGAAERMPDGTVCEGVIGNAKRGKDEFFLQDFSRDFDAALLKLPGNDYPFLKYCRLNNRFQRQTVYATGFPLKSPTGVPSSRVGVLSTTQIPANGQIETDSTTTEGMSGGMVTLANSSHLIGIVSGVSIDPGTGIPSHWSVLAAQVLDDDFGNWGLKEDTEGCLKPRFTEVLGKDWHAGRTVETLGVKPEEGFCYITRVWGQFDNVKDSVAVRIDPDKGFQLEGVNAGAGDHGAEVQCVRF